MTLTVGDVLNSKNPAPKPKKWMGTRPVICDVCHRPLAVQFIDGRTILGPWALMCIHCHAKVGLGLGTGKGQKYDLATLVKLEG